MSKRVPWGTNDGVQVKPGEITEAWANCQTCWWRSDVYGLTAKAVRSAARRHVAEKRPEGHPDHLVEVGVTRTTYFQKDDDQPQVRRVGG